MSVVGVAGLFGEGVESYDLPRRQLVPCFDEFYGAILELVPAGLGDSFRVLDLGAGTGLLGAMVGRNFPRSEVTMVDFSEEMLDAARSRFSDESEGRYTFRLMDYAREPLPGEYEVVVSALSIHHVEDDAKRRLFREVHRVLVDGGVFVNGDQILGGTPEIEARYHESWLRRARELGAGEEDISSALRRMETDKCATLESQVGWMREAGFASVERRYENERFAVYSGRKDAP
ncbi:MAG: class I SAM-dependent methyltransferase [Actinomycetota bacterium]|jgi:tRNA (cmo5U34)-methyltransferase|nr:class I SAM-dependent methyltransferase [Actinomycetota bacterium]